MKAIFYFCSTGLRKDSQSESDRFKFRVCRLGYIFIFKDQRILWKGAKSHQAEQHSLGCAVKCRVATCPVQDHTAGSHTSKIAKLVRSAPHQMLLGGEEMTDPLLEGREPSSPLLLRMTAFGVMT